MEMTTTRKTPEKPDPARSDAERMHLIKKVLMETRANKETREKEYRLFKAMQEALKDKLPSTWNYIEHQQTKCTLWDTLLAIPPEQYGLEPSGWEGGKYNSPAAVAADAVAETYGLEKAMDTKYYASIRAIADLVGMPYKILLETYINKYWSINYAEKL